MGALGLGGGGGGGGGGGLGGGERFARKNYAMPELPRTQEFRKGSWKGLNFRRLARKGTREGSTFFYVARFAF